jgi:anti-sigma28 factor (negative regulator of flagellin synthesis)
MSDTRSLNIVRDAAAPELTSTMAVAYSADNGGQRPRERALRSQQVNRLKQAVVSGDYQADPGRIATKLLKRG